MKIVDNFRQLLSTTHYDTVACDIYGVIHDGVRAYPYAKTALSDLKRHDQHVLLLSNSTRLQDKLDANMKDKFDIDIQCYEEILSSGVLTKLFLKDVAESLETGQVISPSCHATAQHHDQGTRMDPNTFAKTHLKTGKFFLAGDPDWQEPLYLPLAPTLSRTIDWNDMEFVLLGSIRGVNPDTPVDAFNEEEVKQDYQPLLDQCLKKSLPIVCANPDVFAPNGLDSNGNVKYLICPGYIGQMYEAMGGKVLYFGKPFRSIYEYLIKNKAKGGVVCVGDNVATDIKGATEAGLDVVMILGGVHWDELKDAKDDDEMKSRVRELCKKHGSGEPTYLMPLLRFE